MEGETNSLNYSSESRRSWDSISILVVDDDTTCLSIVAAILKKFKYEVVTVKHPNDALCTLRIKGDAFDLVVSDVHMPDMNGFELQEAIAHEFKLPVVLMSADNKKGVDSKGLESGASFFISKPVSPDELRDLCQFAAMEKKSQVVLQEAANCFPEKITLAHENNSDEMPISASIVNEGRHNKKDSKRKSPSKEGSDERRSGDNTQSASKKKPKVIWTNALHNRFLEAIRSIGLDRSVPKKILEAMNVPGLTRENVASHLQKYRIFLRRVSDASYKIHYANDHKGLSRSAGLSCASSGTSHSVLMLNRLSKPQYQNPGHFPGANSAPFPNQDQAFCSSLTDQSGLRQYQLISINTGGLLNTNIRHANLIHQNGRQNDRWSARPAHNNYQMNPFFQGGHLSNESLEGLTDSFDASILGSTRINPSISPEVSSHENLGTSNIISTLGSTNFAHQMNQTNYVGYEISNIKHLAESGSCKEYEGLNSCHGTINLQINEFQNNINVKAAALPSDNMNLDQSARYLGGSSYVPDNNDGKQLSDVIADYQNLLLPSNLSLLGNLKNEGLIHESAFSPVYDLPEFDIMATQQPMGEGDLDNNFSDQVNIHNQAQQNGRENSTSSSFHGGMNNWDNHISSYDQAPNQRDDDDFLVSLLAFGPFGEDQFQTLEGI